MLLLLACTAPKDDTAPPDTDTDTDTDTDSDTDTDTDTDSDTDTDTDADSDTDTDTDIGCVPPGLYGAEQWSLDVAQDCSAFLRGFCGEGAIAGLATNAHGSFTTKLTWAWQGGGPSGGKDPATFAGSVNSGVVDGTLSYGSVTTPVHAVLDDAPGDGLGLSACPLD